MPIIAASFNTFMINNNNSHPAFLNPIILIRILFEFIAWEVYLPIHNLYYLVHFVGRDATYL
jgi:hypothetical protein